MDILNALKQLRDDIKIWVTNNLNALNAKIDEKTIPIDSELNSTSTNPVQNQAISKEINIIKERVGDTPVSSQIENAINKIPTFSGDYNDLSNAPDIHEDESGNMTIADEAGNIIFRVDSEGIHTTAMTLDGKSAATEDYVNEAVSNIDIPEVNLDGYATEEFVNQAIENIDIPEVNLDGYATEEFVNQAIENIDIPEVNLDGYATEEFVNNAVETAKEELSESIVSEQNDWTITDDNGNIIAKVDSNGLETTTVTAQSVVVDGVDVHTAIEGAKDYADTKISGHNTSTSAHNDIRTLISDLSTAVNKFLDVDDTTKDQLSEVLTLIDNNKGTLDSLTTSKVNVADIINNLTTNDSSKVLSAAQGVALKALIDELSRKTLPTVSANDNGKFLRVVSGAWSAVSIPNAEEASF